MITVLQQPYKVCLNRQDIIYVASSDNVGEIGFKYKFVITTVQGTFSFYVTPNNLDAMVVNVRDLFSNVVKNSGAFANFYIHSVHSSLAIDDDTLTEFISSVVISEAWTVDGVLTDNTGSEETISDQISIYPGYYLPEFGFNPDPTGSNPDISFQLDGVTKRAQSDRKSTTHVWSWATTFGISSNAICIPVFEEDYGVLCVSATTAFYPDSLYRKVKIQLFDSSGAPHSYTENFQGTSNEAIACYPANLNANTTTVGLPQPADYPNWRFYTIQFLTDADALCGVTYVFYNAYIYGQQDCKHDRVRLGWANSRGGWDYFNFIKKNEESFSMDRKRYHKIRGNYATAYADSAFTYFGADAGLTERGSLVQRFLNITSDWIQEGEFEFLQSLLMSNQVHWLQDDGTFIPVVIEANDYVSKRERNGKMKNLDLKIRLANNLY